MEHGIQCNLITPRDRDGQRESVQSVTTGTMAPFLYAEPPQIRVSEATQQQSTPARRTPYDSEASVESVQHRFAHKPGMVVRERLPVAVHREPEKSRHRRVVHTRDQSTFVRVRRRPGSIGSVMTTDAFQIGVNRPVNVKTRPALPLADVKRVHHQRVTSAMHKKKSGENVREEDFDEISCKVIPQQAKELHSSPNRKSEVEFRNEKSSPFGLSRRRQLDKQALAEILSALESDDEDDDSQPSTNSDTRHAKRVIRRRSSSKRQNVETLHAELDDGYDTRSRAPTRAGRSKPEVDYDESDYSDRPVRSAWAKQQKQQQKPAYVERRYEDYDNRIPVKTSAPAQQTSNRRGRT